MINLAAPAAVATITLAPGVASAAIDFDTTGCRSVGVSITNTGGTNAVTTISLARSVDGTSFEVADTTSIASIAHDTTAAKFYADVAFSKLRVILTSTSGTTVTLACRGPG